MESKNNTNDHPEDTKPVIPPISPQHKEEHSPARGPIAEQKLNDNDKPPSRWMIRFTGAIAFAAVVQGIIGYYQWDTMSGQRTIMDNTLREIREGGKDTRKLAEAAKTQSDATKTIAERSGIAANAAKKSAEVAEKTLVAIQRPWVSVKASIASDLKFTPEGGRVSILFRLKNIGQTPATGTWIDARIFPSGPKRDAFTEKKKLCSRRESASPKGKAMGHILFPGDEVVLIESLPISSKEIEQFRVDMAEYHKDPSLKTFPVISPALVGCVSYGFAFDNSFHSTGIAEDIHRIDPKHPGAAFGIEPSAGDVPQNLLRLDTIFWAGASNAD